MRKKGDVGDFESSMVDGEIFPHKHSHGSQRMDPKRENVQ